MDLLDRLLGHDAWTTHQLLLRCRSLTDEQLDRELDIGHRTVRVTLLHIIRNVELWSDLMASRPVRVDQGARPQERSVSALIARLVFPTKEMPRLSDRCRVTLRKHSASTECPQGALCRFALPC